MGYTISDTKNNNNLEIQHFSKVGVVYKDHYGTLLTISNF